MEQDNPPPVPESAPEPEVSPTAEETAGMAPALESPAADVPAPPAPPAVLAAADAPEDFRGLGWAFIGETGLRAGWSILIFIPLFLILTFALGTAASLIVRNIAHGKLGSGSALAAGVGELVPFLAMLLTATVVALIERRSLLAYNLQGPQRTRNFFAGFVAGFAALSMLVGALAAGGYTSARSRLQEPAS